MLLQLLIITTMEKDIQALINKVKKRAQEVYEELGEGWPECVDQKAMEVVLRERG